MRMLNPGGNMVFPEKASDDLIYGNSDKGDRKMVELTAAAENQAQLLMAPPPGWIACRTAVVLPSVGSPKIFPADSPERLSA